MPCPKKLTLVNNDIQIKDINNQASSKAQSDNNTNINYNKVPFISQLANHPNNPSFNANKVLSPVG